MLEIALYYKTCIWKSEKVHLTVCICGVGEGMARSRLQTWLKLLVQNHHTTSREMPSNGALDLYWAVSPALSSSTTHHDCETVHTQLLRVAALINTAHNLVPVYFSKVNCHSKVTAAGFWSVIWTNKDICRCHWALAGYFIDENYHRSPNKFKELITFKKLL